MGLPKLQFQDLRKTFASLLAQKGVSTAVTQRLLEHSSPQLTNDVYTNVDPVLRQAVSLLPVADWLQTIIDFLRISKAVLLSGSECQVSVSIL